MPRIACPADMKAVPLFSALADEEVSALLPCIQHRSYPARSIILQTGQKTEWLYVILSGCVKVLVEDTDGRELTLSLLGPNEFFGEMGIIDGQPCSATVEARGVCDVLCVPRKNIIECLRHNADAAMWMLGTVVVRLRDAHRKLESLALMSVYDRVARFLLEQGREATNGEWLVESNSQQIANIVGASREMVSRVVKVMIEKGFVRRHRRKLIVLNRASIAERKPRRLEACGTHP